MILFIVSMALVLGAALVFALSRPIDKISLKESMDLCNLPIVTFINDDKKFNFLLDTGSDRNHMSKAASKKIVANDTEYKVSTMGFAGSSEENFIKEAEFSYKNNYFKVQLTVSEGLDKSFAFIKQRDGVTVHGILGSTFLREYGYILDFDKLEVYSKRWKKK